MKDLRLKVSDLVPWFEPAQDDPYVMISIPPTAVQKWPEALGEAFRLCYVTDDDLDFHAKRTGLPKSQLVLDKLPDRGSTMAGDFGEILVYLYHAARKHPMELIGPKKWRLKHDRTKAAPYSDVVHFVVTEWPNPTDQDELLCSEVKTKSTDSPFNPILSAIRDSKTDRTSRLSKTLVWLRERASFEDLGSTTIEHLNRFINSTDYPPYKKEFRAVAVICGKLIKKELENVPSEVPDGHTLVIISVPDLKSLYEVMYDTALASVSSGGGAK